MSQIESLPPIVLIKIFARTSIRDKFAFQSVSKKFSSSSKDCLSLHRKLLVTESITRDSTYYCCKRIDGDEQAKSLSHKDWIPWSIVYNHCHFILPLLPNLITIYFAANENSGENRSHLPDGGIRLLLESCPKIEYLLINLPNMVIPNDGPFLIKHLHSNEATVSSMNYFIKTCPDLKVLDLEMDGRNFKENIFSHLPLGLKQLKLEIYFNVADREFIDWEHDIDINVDVNVTSIWTSPAVASLEAIEVTGDYAIMDSETAPFRCPRLKKFVFNRNINVSVLSSLKFSPLTHLEMQAGDTTVNFFRSIHSLESANLTKITDSVLQVLCQNNRRLSRLDLTEAKLSDACFPFLGSLPSLTELTMTIEKSFEEVVNQVPRCSSPGILLFLQTRATNPRPINFAFFQEEEWIAGTIRHFVPSHQLMAEKTRQEAAGSRIAF